MRVLIAVCAVASGNGVHAPIPGQVVLRVEGDRQIAVDLAEAPEVPVRRTAEEDAITHVVAQPREGLDVVSRPGRFVLGVQHELGRTGRRGAHDVEGFAQPRYAPSLSRPVVRDDELAALQAEVDLDPGHARRVALAQRREGVLRMRSAPRGAVRLQLDEPSVRSVHDRFRMRGSESALAV